VQPRAKRSEFVGWHGDAVKVRLAAPPVDGAANDELISLLTRELGIPRTDIEIVKGVGSRRKRVAISGLTHQEILQRLRLA
jgi:uncharacterized protein (TIGR00251 family)